MDHSLKIKKTHLFCGMLFLVSLISGQSEKLFGISNGTIYKILYFSKYFASLFLFTYSMSKRSKVPRFEVSRFIKIFVPLIALMFIVELVAAFTSPIPVIYGLRYWSRSLFVFLDRICIYMSVISIWILCADTSVDCLTNTLLIDELLIFISALFKLGIFGVLKVIISALTFRGFTSNYFEVHEQTYVIGLCIIYYLFFNKEKKFQTGKLILLIISFILGAKRIGFLGIVIAGLLALFVHKKGLTRYKLIIIGFVGVFICFFYLFIIYKNEFFAILNERNINNMGRDLIYGYFTKRTRFSISQMGWGMAGVSKAIENMDRSEVMYMSVIRGLHNDILRIYVDFGFIGSLLWYIFNLMYVPTKFLERYGKGSATVYMTMILYIFIIYLTDNMESSYICQMAIYIFPLMGYLKGENNVESCNDEIKKIYKKTVISE